MVTRRSRTERNLSPWIFHCCCVLSFHILSLSFTNANRIVEQCQQWLWFGKLTLMSAYCHCLGFLIFLKCLFFGVILISVVWLIFSFYRPPTPLENTTFPLFPPVPSDVYEWSWHLILYGYSFVWYDGTESLFAFQRRFPFRFSGSPVCDAERATVKESACVLHELICLLL